MCQYFETIRVTDGIINHLEYHNRRMNYTRLHFWPDSEPLSLENKLPDCKGFTGKAKVCYDKSGFTSFILSEYNMRKVQSLRLVNADDIDYSYKSTDRSSLDILSKQKEDADEILIVRKGLITDTSYTNVVLYDGKIWYTPLHPLLNGTMRQYLIDRDIIFEKDIRVENLGDYQEIRLINAMIDFGKISIKLSNVYDE